VTTGEEARPGGPNIAADGVVVGMAIWFLNYSTWDGVHGIYLEDLYVRPEHRGSGLGKALLVALAQECVREGYSRLSWWVLDWNSPAIGFYQSIGAKAQDEWTTYRLCGDALAALAESE
jgi:GNAT superfamily N-acetyltransferase